MFTLDSPCPGNGGRAGRGYKDEARKPKKGDCWTSTLDDDIFIPYKVGETARENYVEISYVNDVNRAYA